MKQERNICLELNVCKNICSLEIIPDKLHRKNGFGKVPKNLIRYTSENNFVGSSK